MFVPEELSVYRRRDLPHEMGKLLEARTGGAAGSPPLPQLFVRLQAPMIGYFGIELVASFFSGMWSLTALGLLIVCGFDPAYSISKQNMSFLCWVSFLTLWLIRSCLPRRHNYATR
jgi:hypothetical protein